MIAALRSRGVLDVLVLFVMASRAADEVARLAFAMLSTYLHGWELSIGQQAPGCQQVIIH
jgi:hypothetical protein